MTRGAALQIMDRRSIHRCFSGRGELCRVCRIAEIGHVLHDIVLCTFRIFLCLRVGGAKAVEAVGVAQSGVKPSVVSRLVEQDTAVILCKPQVLRQSGCFSPSMSLSNE